VRLLDAKRECKRGSVGPVMLVNCIKVYATVFDPGKEAQMACDWRWIDVLQHYSASQDGKSD